jgi:prolyl-tRNA editing enzyme YbaK/EbsC (Cys-tRNA(Pro) deacylase)
VNDRNSRVVWALITDTEMLARALGATAIGKASPRMVREATGQVIGGVAPVGHPRRLRTVVDESLAQHPIIWTAAGTADSVMPLTYAKLLAVTEGIAVPVH